MNFWKKHCSKKTRDNPGLFKIELVEIISPSIKLPLLFVEANPEHILVLIRHFNSNIHTFQFIFVLFCDFSFLISILPSPRSSKNELLIILGDILNFLTPPTFFVFEHMNDVGYRCSTLIHKVEELRFWNIIICHGE